MYIYRSLNFEKIKYSSRRYYQKPNEYNEMLSEDENQGNLKNLINFDIVLCKKKLK